MNPATQVTQLYLAMFNRAPDAEGLAFWASGLDQGKTMAEIAQDMFNTAPAREYYPDGAAAEEVVSAFYLNALGREPDAEGLAFWTEALKSASDEGTFVLDIIDVVDNYDGDDPDGLSSKALFDNKVAIGEHYAGELGGGLEHATTLLDSVDAGTDTSSLDAINAFIGAHAPDLIPETDPPPADRSLSELVGTYQLTDFEIVALERGTIDPNDTTGFTGHMVITEDHYFRGTEFEFADGTDGFEENAPLTLIGDQLLFAGLYDLDAGYEIEYGMVDRQLEMEVEINIPTEEGFVNHQDIYIWDQISVQPDFGVLEPYGISPSDADMWLI